MNSSIPKQLLNQCGMQIRKFAIKLDQFSGMNTYAKVGMTSKLVVNYYEYFLSKDDKYKQVNRGFQKHIGIVNDLMKDVESNSLNKEKNLNKVKDFIKNFQGFINQLKNIQKRLLEAKTNEKVDETSPKNMSVFLNEFQQVILFVINSLKKIQEGYKK